MGHSILNSVIAFILAVFLLFVGPIFSIYESIDTMSDTLAKNALNSFQKNVRKNGYVDTKTYIEFLNNLSKSGRVYTVTMVHTSRLAFPSNNNPGDYEIHNIAYGTENILSVVKDGKSKYCMRYGDDYKVIIKERDMAPSRALLAILRGKYANNLLTFTGGGMVENEVTE